MSQPLLSLCGPHVKASPSVFNLAAMLMKRLSLLAGMSSVLLISSSCQNNEVCDWRDNDKDGVIDEGFDADNDGYWACGVSQQSQALGQADCDDTDASVHPASEEVCNGIDDNCDGNVDEVCMPSIVTISEPVHKLIGAEASLQGSLLVLGTQGGVQSVTTIDLTTPSAPTVYPSQKWENRSILSLSPLTSSRGDPLELMGLMGYGLMPLYAEQDAQLTLLQDAWIPLWYDQESKPKMRSPADILSACPTVSDDYFVITGHLDFEPLISTYIVDAKNPALFEAFDWVNLDAQYAGSAADDINGDGRCDVVVACGQSLSWRTVSLNEQASTQQIDFDDNIGDFSIGDIDLDGDADLVVTVPRRWLVLLLKNDGHGAFDEIIEVPQTLRHPELIELADLNGDGWSDLALIDPALPSVQLIANLGADTFGAPCDALAGPGIVDVLALSTPESQGSSRLITGHSDGSVRLVDTSCLQ